MAASRRATLNDGRERQLARLGTRLGARIIDTILVIVGAWLLGRIGVGIVILDILPGVGIFGLIIVMSIIILGYEVTMIALTGQTVGKMMAGIKVVRAVDGDIPGWGKSFKRFLVPQLPALIPVIGWLVPPVVYLSTVFDDRRQGWHDKAAHTFVVRA